MVRESGGVLLGDEEGTAILSTWTPPARFYTIPDIRLANDRRSVADLQQYKWYIGTGPTFQNKNLEAYLSCYFK